MGIRIAIATCTGVSRTVKLWDSAKVLRVYDDLLDVWYETPPDSVSEGGDLESLLRAEHFSNFKLWGLEDSARRKDVPDSHIAEIKHSIDYWNQRRNDYIEKIDAVLISVLEAGGPMRGPLHSETAGMILDRLSILSLKIRNMKYLCRILRDDGLRGECSAKSTILGEQRRDLASCFDLLIADCASGLRRFKIYRQCKTYNDPRLNPELADWGGNNRSGG